MLYGDSLTEATFSCEYSRHLDPTLTQSRWQITGRVVFVLDDIVTFVDRVEEGERIPHLKQSGQVLGDQSLSRRPRR